MRIICIFGSEMVVLEAALSRISKTWNLCFWKPYGTKNGIRGISNSHLKVGALCPPPPNTHQYVCKAFVWLSSQCRHTYIEKIKLSSVNLDSFATVVVSTGLGSKMEISPLNPILSLWHHKWIFFPTFNI